MYAYHPLSVIQSSVVLLFIESQTLNMLADVFQPYIT